MAADVYSQSMFLVIKVAYLYYIENKSQNEIALQLKISITTVSRLLKKAKTDKIVEFVICNPYVECIHLEEDLKNTFGLKDVVIAPSASEYDESLDDGENIKKLVALEGARYLQRIIKDGDVLGITWGSTIYHMVNYLNPAQKVNAEFVTLHGSYAYCDSKFDAPNLALRMAKAFSGGNYALVTNALMSSKQVADIIKNEKNTRDIIQKFKKINIAIVGIGSFYPEITSILTKSDFLTKEELSELQAQHVVGDIAFRFFDYEGKECNTQLVDRMITIDFDVFKKIKKKICLASGTQKANSVLSAIKGGLVDVLIVDSSLGKTILSL